MVFIKQIQGGDLSRLAGMKSLHILAKVVITWILVGRHEISTLPTGADFTLRLQGEIKFHPGKAGQFSTWYSFRFVYIFFSFFLCKHISLRKPMIPKMIKFCKDIC